ncbi:DEAD/DEAH box helicase [Ruegeria sediminis]|uniref:DEAD/DEAH box helicase n=1 Tax=Ruegeria sediminis TaxID=2583820 RepID=A0ABY2WTN3_9RHOB|nr:DEAD/DEAH box helicase [Ruegeria sediminis]TMV03762.1 DEAD/DEAH box helicase [Ruegeria sediminis]
MKQALADALQERGYDTLTPVQQAVTEPELEGRDLLVSAQTGSGKTVGFGLALAPTLLDGETFDDAAEPLALIIAPTRELAMQVKRELAWLYAKTGAVVASCVGGMDMRDERRALERGAHIVVATPGRLRDHIMRGSIDLTRVRGIVLDEADEMLDLGFREDLEVILGEAPETRRTLMFSATVPKGIAALAQSYQKDAQRVTALAESRQHADIEYRLMQVAPQDAENAIINVLRYYEAPNAIVFANTRAMVSRLTTRLSNRGFSVVALSGELTQSERTNALQAMRDGRARICVATDVAARGIDLPGLDLVVHAELPSNHETLLHRSGRTGRAGRKGVSVLIAPPKVRAKAQRLLGWAKVSAETCEAPSAEAVLERDETRMLADPAWQEQPSDTEQAAAARLLERFSPEQIAAAFLRLYRSRHSAPEELGAVQMEKRQKTRAEFGPSVWFSISGGRAAGAEPRHYLPMLCKAGDLDRDAIGAIRVQDRETFVEIREAAVEGFLKALDGRTEIEPGAVLTRLANAPDIKTSPRPPMKSKPAPHRGKGAKPAKSARPPHKIKSPEDRPDPAPERPAAAAKPKRKPPAKAGHKPREQTRKGPQPPVGKPNSKKNKARRAADGRTPTPKGGDARPHRATKKPKAR